MGEFSIHHDSAKNRLYLRLKGFFRGREGEMIYAELETALEQVRPGFDVITDISGFVPGSTEAIAILRKGAELVKSSGRRNAVRVTGGLMSGLLQFKRVLSPVFDEGQVHYATSLAEADSILDALMTPD